MNPFKKNEKQKRTPKELEKHVDFLEEKIKDLSTELKELKKDMRKAVVKVNITRYNPFKEIGGDQSFSIALLDEDNNGIIVTSHYGHDGNRVYAKPIQKGKADYSLSEEESRILKETIENHKKDE